MNTANFKVGQLITVLDKNGDEFDAEILEDMMGGYFRVEVDVAESAKHQFWTVNENRMRISEIQPMNDTKDIQTIRAVIGLNIDPCTTWHKDVDIIHEAEFALSRLEARLSAHQEVVSTLESVLFAATALTDAIDHLDTAHDPECYDGPYPNLEQVRDLTTAQNEYYTAIEHADLILPPARAALARAKEGQS